MMGGARALPWMAVLGLVLACRSAPRSYYRPGADYWAPSTTTPVGGAAAARAQAADGSTGGAPGTGEDHSRLSLSQDTEPGAQRISLAEVLRVAGDESLALAIAREIAKMARADEQRVLDSLLPTLSAELTFRGQDGLVQNTAGSFLEVDRHNTFAGVGTELIFDPAVAYYRVEESSALSEATMHAIHGASNDVLRQAANLYINLVESYVRLEIARGSVRDFEEIVALERNRFEGGEVSEARVVRAQARLIRASRDVLSAKRKASESSTALVALLGLSPTLELYPSEVDFQLLTLVHTDDLEQLLEIGWQRRPELAAAVARTRSALREHEYYENSWKLPHLEGVAIYGGLGENEEDLSDHFAYTVSLRWEALMTDYSGRQRARANHRRAALEEEMTRREITQEVVNAVHSVRSSRTMITSAIEEVRATQEVFDSSMIRYESGDTDQSDVLWAEIDLVNAQNSLAQAVGSHNRAQYDLLRAIGGPRVEASTVGSAGMFGGVPELNPIR